MSTKNLHIPSKYVILQKEREKKGSDTVTKTLLDRLHAFVTGKWAALTYTAVACLTVSLSLTHYVIPLFILWMLLVLVLDGNFLHIFLPLTLLCGFAIRTSGQATVLLGDVWLAVPVVIVIVLHFILYGKRPLGGKLLLPQLAISVALLLGGLFHISAAEYFRLDALYYVLLLGVGMVFFYLWFRNGVHAKNGVDIKEKLMSSLYALGVFCAYSILDQALRMYLATGTLVASYVWANDICELMLFCIPAAFYYAKKNYLHILTGFAFCGVMVFTASLSALLVGGILLVLCLLYLAYHDKRRRVLTLLLFALVCLGALLILLLISRREGGLAGFFRDEENNRVNLLREAWEGFLASPVFGVGIGAAGEVETTFMTVNWTHNFPMQILGSMGILGVLAYGYQLYARARLVLAHPRDPFFGAAALSYLGLLLISFFQPGEFCPMPYALMAVMIFAVLEAADEETREKTKPKTEEKTGAPS